MKNRIISIFLCLCMCTLLIVPTGVSVCAEEIEKTPGAVKVDGLETNKTVKKNKDGSYTLGLEAFTTGKVSAVPTDVVLVLDLSGSMADAYGNITAIKAMQDSAKAFIKTLDDDANANNVTHRVAIVTYNDGAKTENGFTNSNSDGLIKTIDKLKVKTLGKTNTAAGIKNAKNLFEKDSLKSEKRNRAVIVFTDGAPSDGFTFSQSVADSAIAEANAMKKSGIKIYSVGIFKGANKDELYSPKCSGNVSDSWSKKEVSVDDIAEVVIPACNRFLNYLSSNFVSANSLGAEYKTKVNLSGMTQTCTITQNFDRTSSDYYLTANDKNALLLAFNKIAKHITEPLYKLDSNTVIKDVLSDYFTLPQGTKPEDIKVYTQEFKGGKSFDSENWERRIEVSSNDVETKINERTISVTGFDFDENCVTETRKPESQNYGKKLVIEFKITRNSDFIGGYSVPTNSTDSGVYVGGSLIENFDIPNTSVPILFDFNKIDQKIYVTNKVMLENALSEINKLDGINNKFVNIVYTIKDSSNKEVCSCEIAPGTVDKKWKWAENSQATIHPNSKTEYTVECVVTSKTSGGNLTNTLKPKTITAYVFKPYVEVKNRKVNYNTKVNLNDNIKSVSWKCADLDPTVTVEGEAPKLTYEFDSIPEMQLLQDKSFKITKISVGDVDITSQTNLQNDGKFNIELNRFNLTITNAIDGDVIDQTMVLKLRGDDGSLYSIPIAPNDFKNGNAIKTIKGLYCGVEYTVVEDENWSWRFTPGSNEDIINSDVDGELKGLQVTNSRDNTKWLSGWGNIV